MSNILLESVWVNLIEMDKHNEFATRSDGSLVSDVLVDVVHVVLVFAVVVFAASHEVKKAWNVDVHLLFV